MSCHDGWGDVAAASRCRSEGGGALTLAPISLRSFSCSRRRRTKASCPASASCGAPLPPRPFQCPARGLRAAARRGRADAAYAHLGQRVALLLEGRLHLLQHLEAQQLQIAASRRRGAGSEDMRGRPELVGRHTLARAGRRSPRLHYLLARFVELLLLLLQLQPPRLTQLLVLTLHLHLPPRQPPPCQGTALSPQACRSGDALITPARPPPPGRPASPAPGTGCCTAAEASGSPPGRLDESLSAGEAAAAEQARHSQSVDNPRQPRGGVSKGSRWEEGREGQEGGG